MTRRDHVLAIAAAFLVPALSLAQVTPAADSTAEAAHKMARIFSSTAPLQFTLTANFGRIRKDRQEKPPYHWARISYTGDDGATVTLPIQARARGIWRRKNCDLPPLRLHFAKDEVKHSVFAKEKNLKLVMHCRDDDTYEQYILMEFQLYRVYNQLTPLSHLARLARVTYADSASGKTIATRYAFLLEDIDALAERNNAVVAKQQGAQPGDLDPTNDALMGVFQYMIGNTDFSESALHNIELLNKNLDYVGVVHDFDFSGAVNARYATVDPRLPIRVVRDRVMRGYCVPDSFYTRVFSLFDRQRPAIYALYSDSLGKLMDPRLVKSTLEYFDEFYRVIDDPKAAKRQIIDACLGRK